MAVDRSGTFASYDFPLGLGGIRLDNLRTIFSGGVCESCLVPIGERSGEPLALTFEDGQARRYDGLMAQLDERPRGPTMRLYSERFLEKLTPEERESIVWRAVTVRNPTKITMRYFEPVACAAHGKIVALRGGSAEFDHCVACDRSSPPSYYRASVLPEWLLPNGPSLMIWFAKQYVLKQSLPDPLPAAFMFGEWTRGAMPFFTSPQFPRIDASRKGMIGVDVFAVGVVDESLVAR